MDSLSSYFLFNHIYNKQCSRFSRCLFGGIAKRHCPANREKPAPIQVASISLSYKGTNSSFWRFSEYPSKKQTLCSQYVVSLNVQVICYVVLGIHAANLVIIRDMTTQTDKKMHGGVQRARHRVQAVGVFRMAGRRGLRARVARVPPVRCPCRCCGEVQK